MDYKWGIHWCYNPLTNHLLTSWDIQAWCLSPLRIGLWGTNHLVTGMMLQADKNRAFLGHWFHYHGKVSCSNWNGSNFHGNLNLQYPCRINENLAYYLPTTTNSWLWFIIWYDISKSMFSGWYISATILQVKFPLENPQTNLVKFLLNESSTKIIGEFLVESYPSKGMQCIFFGIYPTRRDSPHPLNDPTFNPPTWRGWSWKCYCGWWVHSPITKKTRKTACFFFQDFSVLKGCLKSQKGRRKRNWIIQIIFQNHGLWISSLRKTRPIFQNCRIDHPDLAWKKVSSAQFLAFSERKNQKLHPKNVRCWWREPCFLWSDWNDPNCSLWGGSTTPLNTFLHCFLSHKKKTHTPKNKKKTSET